MIYVLSIYHACGVRVMFTPYLQHAYNSNDCPAYEVSILCLMKGDSAMAKIEQVVVGGPDIVEAQDRVLRLLGKHTDHVFCLNNSDIIDLRAWLADPEGDEPPPAYNESTTYSVTLIRRALRLLRATGKIASIELSERTYYGNPDAIRRIKETVKKSKRAAARASAR